jgi:hypothetical protein
MRLIRIKLRNFVKEYDLDTCFFEFVDWLHEYLFEIMDTWAFYFFDSWNIISIAEFIYLYNNKTTFRKVVWRFSGIYARRYSKQWYCEYHVNYENKPYVVNVWNLWVNIKLVLRYIKVIFCIVFWVIYAVICLWLKFLSILIPKLFLCLVVSILIIKIFPYVYKFIKKTIEFIKKTIDVYKGN